MNTEPSYHHQTPEERHRNRDYPNPVGATLLWLEIMKGATTKELRESSRAIARDLLRAALQMPA